MTEVFPNAVNLGENQIMKVAQAVMKNMAITLRLQNHQLNGSHELLLPKTQINKILRAVNRGVGTDVRSSKSHIRKSVQQGRALWSSIAPLANKVPPVVTAAAKK